MESRNTNQEAFSVLQMKDDSGLHQSGFIMEKDKIYSQIGIHNEKKRDIKGDSKVSG